MKKVTVASDSFKGSLTSWQVAEAVSDGVRAVYSDCEVVKVNVADGGEGTVDALTEMLDGIRVETVVSDPLGRPVPAVYGIIDGGGTAVIEMSAASGLPLLSEEERNPYLTSTYGTGEMISDALRRGCRKFLVGIGGSATNDAGTGMLSALGFRFLDSDGHILDGCGKSLAEIASVDASGVLPEVMESEFVIACDVDNPFCGPSGAAYVFAPQKGADMEMVRALDAGMNSFAEVIRRYCGTHIVEHPGAGAAGGLGGAFKAFLNAELCPGIEMVLDAVRFCDMARGSDLVITGEGRVDSQTLHGKTPAGVFRRAESLDIPVLAIGGSVLMSDELKTFGFCDIIQVTPEGMTLEQAMRKDVASSNIRSAVAAYLKRLN